MMHVSYEMWFWQLYLQGVAIGLIVFILYLELRPDLGGLFLRPGQKGETVLEWGGFWQLWRDLIPGRGGSGQSPADTGSGRMPDQVEGKQSSPDTGLPLWSREYLDMNPLVVSQAVALLYLLLCLAGDVCKSGDFFSGFRMGDC